MKIAFIVPFANFQYSGGITVQGRMWKEGLEKLGHQVDLINNWDKYDWNSYDYIIFLGYGNSLLEYVRELIRFKHPKIVSAPIMDYHEGLRKFTLKSKYFGSVRLRYHRPLHDLYYCRRYFDFYLVRSEHEARFFSEGYGEPKEKIKAVPISFRIQEYPEINLNQKENFVFHASRLADPGKNVERLVEAAKKYNFNLILAGTLNGSEQEEWMHELIDGHDNIKCVGWISDEQLKDYYRRAKVLALPSIIEGVGMVALEAAIYGCEIVLTNLGAPKEYWNGQAVLVDPYDVDSIGKGVIEALNAKNAQPRLREFIIDKYNSDTCVKQLETCLLNELKKDETD